MTVTTDLAALARDNRRGLVPLAVSLRVLATPPTDRTLVSLSRAFAARVARAAAGATALAYSAFVLTVLADPGGICLDREGNSRMWTWFEPHDVFVRFAVFPVVAYAVAGWLAERAFSRQTTRGVDRAVRLVDRAERAAFVLAALGVTVAGATLAAGLFLCGDNVWFPLAYFQGAPEIAAATVSHVAIAGAASTIVVVRLARRHHPIPRFVAPIAGAALLATLTVAFAADAGNLMTNDLQSTRPSEPLRFALTLAGTLSAAVLASVLLSRLHRAERGSRQAP